MKIFMVINVVIKYFQIRSYSDILGGYEFWGDIIQPFIPSLLLFLP